MQTAVHVLDGLLVLVSHLLLCFLVYDDQILV